jgi:ribosomal protein S24E
MSDDYDRAYLEVTELLSICKPIYPLNPIEFIHKNYPRIILLDYSVFSENQRELLYEQDTRGMIAITESNRKMILYNSEKGSPCMRFTLMHELYHYINNHSGGSALEEKQANCFARNIIAPVSCINKEKLSIDYIESTFGLSHDAARLRVKFYDTDCENMAYAKEYYSDYLYELTFA